MAQALALRRIHEAFHAGKDVGGSVRAVVAQSWARSGDAGLDPVDHLPPILMDEREIDDRWSHHPLYPVLPMLRELLREATSESGHMLVISDARGVLMWIEGHHRVVEATERHAPRLRRRLERAGAGTNALGTAIAVDHPVQIFSAEHFNRIVHPWQCSGAPIHDPVTGEILGVIDLTGHLRTAHPHTLSLVTAAAGMAEAYLRHDRPRQDQAMREAYLERVAGVSQPTALVRPSGHVVTALPSDWLPPLVAPAAGRPRAGAPRRPGRRRGGASRGRRARRVAPPRAERERRRRRRPPGSSCSAAARASCCRTGRRCRSPDATRRSSRCSCSTGRGLTSRGAHARPLRRGRQAR